MPFVAAVNIEAENQRQKQSCYQDDRAADKENRVDHAVIITTVSAGNEKIMQSNTLFCWRLEIQFGL